MVDPEAMGGHRRDDEPDLEGEAGERLVGLTKAKTTQSQDEQRWQKAEGVLAWHAQGQIPRPSGIVFQLGMSIEWPS